MTGWAPIKAAGGDVSRWGQGKGGLGHRWALHRRSNCRCGGGMGVVGASRAGVLKKARIGLREGQFGQRVG